MVQLTWLMLAGAASVTVFADRSDSSMASKLAVPREAAALCPKACMPSLYKVAKGFKCKYSCDKGCNDSGLNNEFSLIKELKNMGEDCVHPRSSAIRCERLATDAKQCPFPK
ncbi:hypothetical protein VHEMI01213 [[Torrubiella] hemipterigena]|uniref:Extracellular membrane protein CFEM domain-containing protein n=1 Tax=[Torrubiella] hemipterigena TaxID=1531966 RepID=A0A0A1SLA4_9HYPO|nr:hypothetical protein VHEMI01213 [[Torrubiella] hemipterigena]